MSKTVAELRAVGGLVWRLCTGSIRPNELRSALSRPDSRSAHLLRFVLVGGSSALGFLLMFLALRPFVGALVSNAVALLLTALANTEANRRLTFGIRGRARVVRQHLQGLAVFGFGLGLTSLALVGLQAVVAVPARWLEIVVLMAANAFVTITRFLLLRAWFVGRSAPDDPVAPQEDPVAPQGDTVASRADPIASPAEPTERIGEPEPIVDAAYHDDPAPDDQLDRSAAGGVRGHPLEEARRRVLGQSPRAVEHVDT